MAITGMRGGKAEIRGMTDLQRKLDALPEAVTAKLKKKIREGAFDIAEQAHFAAPVVSGELRRSIDIVVRNQGFDVYVVANAPHAHLVEFGTVKSAARPFFYPAYKLQRPRVVRSVKTELRRVLRAEAAK